MPQNTIGQREHFIRTLDLEIAGRGERSRPVDRDLIAALERVGDYRSPIFGRIQNGGTRPLTFTIEQSADPLTAPFANAEGTVAFTGTVADGDTVTLDDGTTTVVFEFDDDSAITPGNIGVDIVSNQPTPYGNRRMTLQNLIAAIRLYGTVERRAIGTVELTGNPADTNEVTLDDGSGPQVFEFDDNLSITGDVPVTIGADATGSINNLLNAINLGVRATGTLTFTASGLPVEDDELEISDGVTTVTFEFNDTEVAATGWLQAVAKANYAASTDYFTITDAGGIVHAFWFDTTGSDTIPAGAVAADFAYAMDINAATDAASVGVIIETAINTAAIGVTADDTAGAGRVDIDIDLAGDEGNTWVLAEVVADAGFTVTTFAGGTGSAGAGNVRVQIGGTAAITRDNLIAAIQASALVVDPIDTTTGDEQITIRARDYGTGGNAYTLAITGALPAVSGATLAGGQDPAVGITATKRAGVDILDLVSSTPGSAGNVTTTKTGANITVTGMAGGADVTGPLELLVEDYTPLEGARNTADPIVLITHFSTGVGGNNALAKSGAGITVVGMTGGKNPVSFTEHQTPGGAATSSLTVVAGGTVIFNVGETSRYLRLRATPANATPANPSGDGPAEGYVSLAYWTGKLEEYERSNLTQVPQLA